MHRIVPELIVRNFRAGCYSGSFPAVGMFLDLSGFSATTDALIQHGQQGAEVLAGLMHNVFDPVITSIFEHKGMVTGFAGDSIMALYPIEEDDAQTAAGYALATAWNIQKNLAANLIQETSYGTFSFSVKIGLTYGMVSWGILQSRDNKHAVYYFRGPAVDDSAEAEHHAGRGEIALTENLHQVLRGDVFVEPYDSYYRVIGVRRQLPDIAAVDLPPVDVETVRFFVPEDVVTQDLRGEFRQVVNLFMRFPELPDDKLRSFMHVILDLQEQYGGLLNRLNFGDKGCTVLMLWGVPVAYENSISRALNFVLDLQAASDFPISAGVTFYMAHAGYLGSAMSEDYTCYGWGVNLAARFMMNAPTGQIWIDERIAHRIAKQFNLESVGVQNFKGFAEPQKVYVLKEKLPNPAIAYQGEIVGRQDDLERLARFVEPLWKHQYAGVLAVRGEAGVGKGRLVYEFRSSDVFREHQANWAVCRNDQIVRGPFNPFRHWLSNYFGLTSRAPGVSAMDQFDSVFERLVLDLSAHELGSDLSRFRSVLGALVDLHWADSFYERLDAEGRYNNILLALITLVKAESLRQPLILYIDDAHNLDPESLLFVKRLKQVLSVDEDSCPIGIILTARKQEMESLFDKEFADLSIDLEGLPLEMVSKLAEFTLGHKASPDLTGLLMSLSEGNPLFIEQILGYMQEESLLETSESGWTIGGWSDQSALPADVHTLLVARLDLLRRDVSDVVQTASVLGREFDVRLLSEMVDDKESILEKVAEAERAGIWSILGSSRGFFIHNLLRDVAYTMQLSSRRQYLHALAVKAIETLFADSLHERYGELAYHSENAGLKEKAHHYLLLAGRASADNYQNTQAVNYFTRALALVPGKNLEAQFNLRCERVKLYDRLGDRISQKKELDLLQELLSQLNNQRCMGAVGLMRAEFFYTTGEFQSAVNWVDRTLAASLAIGEDKVVLGLYNVWLQALLRFGQANEAMQRAHEGLRLARDAGLRLDEGKILNTTGLIALEKGEPDVAGEYFENALAIAREMKDRSLELRVLNNLANLAGVNQGDFSTAREYYLKALGMTRDQGDRYREGMALSNLGWVEGVLGELDAAQGHLEESLMLAREVGNRYNEAYTLINLSSVAEIRGESSESLEYARKANELTRSIGERSGEAWSLFYAGYALLSLGNYEEAKKAFLDSMGIRGKLDQSNLALESSAGLIGVALAVGDLSAAAREAERIVLFLNEGGILEGTDEPLRVYSYCYEALKKVEDPRAGKILEEAGRLLEARTSQLSSDQARFLYVENIPWRRAVQQAWNTARPS